MPNKFKRSLENKLFERTEKKTLNEKAKIFDEKAKIFDEKSNTIEEFDEPKLIAEELKYVLEYVLPQGLKIEDLDNFDQLLCNRDSESRLKLFNVFQCFRNQLPADKRAYTFSWKYEVKKRLYFTYMFSLVGTHIDLSKYICKYPMPF